MEKSLYEIMEIDKGASFDDIKKQYKALIKIHHPDKAKTEEGKIVNERRTAEITEAYGILSNKDKRHIYDSFGTKDNIDDIIKKMTECKKPQTTTVRFNPDIEINVNISFMDIYNGTTITRTFTRSIVTLGQKGKQTEKETVKVIIPRGCPDEHRIVFGGAGNVLINNGKRTVGDLVINVSEKEHKMFKRTKNRPLDIYINYPISLAQALLGEFAFDVDCIDGTKVKIHLDNRVIKPGKALIIPEKGMISPKNKVGNMYVVFDIKFPDRFEAVKQRDLKKIFNYTGKPGGTAQQYIDATDLNDFTFDTDDDEEQPQ